MAGSPLGMTQTSIYSADESAKMPSRRDITTNWTLETAGSRSRTRRTLHDTLSTSNIPGATPRKPRELHKPCSHDVSDIQGTSPPRRIPTEVRRRNDFHLTNSDIEYSSPKSKMFRTGRVANPLTPEYKMPSCAHRPITPVPMHHETNQISDIPGTSVAPLFPSSSPPREVMKTVDPELLKAGSSTRRTTPGLGLTTSDINTSAGGKFTTARQTDPLSPRYKVPCPAGLDPVKFAAQYELQGCHPKPRPKQKQPEHCSLSLRSNDICTASTWENYVPYPKNRRHWRRTCDISDIPAAHPTSKFTMMHVNTTRSTDPCNPRYGDL